MRRGMRGDGETDHQQTYGRPPQDRSSSLVDQLVIQEHPYLVPSSTLPLPPSTALFLYLFSTCLYTPLSYSMLSSFLPIHPYFPLCLPVLPSFSTSTSLPPYSLHPLLAPCFPLSLLIPIYFPPCLLLLPSFLIASSLSHSASLPSSMPPSAPFFHYFSLPLSLSLCLLPLPPSSTPFLPYRCLPASLYTPFFLHASLYSLLSSLLPLYFSLSA